jgi:hypothetical protein
MSIKDHAAGATAEEPNQNVSWLNQHASHSHRQAVYPGWSAEEEDPFSVHLEGANTPRQGHDLQKINTWKEQLREGKNQKETTEV